MKTVGAKILDIGKPTKSGYVYNEEAVNSIVEQANKIGIVIGQPCSTVDQRSPSSVDLAKASHIVSDLRVEDGALFAKVTFLGTPNGEICEELYGNERLEVGVRCVGNVSDNGELSNVSLISFDLINK